MTVTVRANNSLDNIGRRFATHIEVERRFLSLHIEGSPQFSALKAKWNKAHHRTIPLSLTCATHANQFLINRVLTTECDLSCCFLSQYYQPQFECRMYANTSIRARAVECRL